MGYGDISLYDSLSGAVCNGFIACRMTHVYFISIHHLLKIPCWQIIASGHVSYRQSNEGLSEIATRTMCCLLQCMPYQQLLLCNQESFITIGLWLTEVRHWNLTCSYGIVKLHGLQIVNDPWICLVFNKNPWKVEKMEIPRVVHIFYISKYPISVTYLLQPWRCLSTSVIAFQPLPSWSSMHILFELL